LTTSVTISLQYTFGMTIWTFKWKMLDILKLQMITHQFHLYATNSVHFMAGTKYLSLFQKHPNWLCGPHEHTMHNVQKWLWKHCTEMCFPKQLIQTIVFIAELSIAKWAPSLVDMKHKHYPVYGKSPLMENTLCILVTSQTNMGKCSLLHLLMFSKP
jgi:hypothetical protein